LITVICPARNTIVENHHYELASIKADFNIYAGIMGEMKKKC
jgi:hypothetical protein